MKKTNIVFITVLLFFTMILTSCELFISEPNEGEGRIILIGVGLNYDNGDEDTYLQYNGYNLNDLNGPANDVKMLSYALQTLSEDEGKDFYWIPLTDEADPDSKNFATEDNINNVMNYLKDSSSAIKPLIIKNPKSYSLATIFDTNTIESVSETIELNSNDILIFHYSGHGASNSGNLILRTNEDLNTAVSFNLEEAYDLFRNLPCKSLLLLDSCYSGNGIPISDTTISTNDPRVEENWFLDYFAFLLDDSTDSESSFESDKNIYILTSTTSEKTCMENSGIKTIGAFTYAVLQALGWNTDLTDSDSIGFSDDTIPALENGAISLDVIYEYISDITHKKWYYDARIIGGRYDLVLFEF